MKILLPCSRTNQHSGESHFPLLKGILRAVLNGKNKCWLTLRKANGI